MSDCHEITPDIPPWSAPAIDGITAKLSRMVRHKSFSSVALCLLIITGMGFRRLLWLIAGAGHEQSYKGKSRTMIGIFTDVLINTEFLAVGGEQHVWPAEVPPL